jgi:predicted  nucleic acid-binding Zn-ribbon protein
MSLYNPIMSQPFKLYRLQQIDTALDQARSRLHKIELSLQDDSAVRQINIQLEAADAAYTQEQKKLRKIEDDVQAQRIKVGQAESSLYGGKVRNPKELQDLEKDIASIRRHIGTLEDTQLDQMMVVEEAETARNRIEDALKSARSQKATQDAMLRADQANLLKDVNRLETERGAAMAGIEPPDLQIYEQLRQSRKGLAVAKMIESTCSACGSELTPAAAQAAQSSNALARCTFCGRILYPG